MEVSAVSTTAPTTARQPTDPEGPTGRLAGWLAGTSLDGIPAPVRERAAHLVLDGLGCALIGAQLPWSRTAVAGVLGLEGAGSVPLSPPGPADGAGPATFPAPSRKDSPMHRQLAPGVTRIATGKRDNAFLVDGDDGFTLVDVGWAKAPDALLDAVADLGRKPSDIRRVVITHAHPDHVQGAAELRRRTGARILVHPADRAWLAAGRVPAEGRSGAAGRFVDRLPKLHWTPVTADGTVADGELVAGGGGLRVIHTPGHSPGHIVLLHEPSGTVLMGDAAFNRGRLALGPAALAADPALRPGSLARLPRDLSAVGFAHGSPLTGAEVDTFQRFLQRIGTGR
jgi:glyoxylase-like metal-dependent hydrolase (beta-lactamase superfamily II)